MYTIDVAKGATNVSVDLEIIDDSDGTPELGVLFNTAGIDLQYRRDFSNAVSITEIDLTTPALDDAHEDGGFLHTGNGVYRFDVPDAAFATGQEKVVISGTVTGMIVIPVTVQLVNEIDLGSDGRVLVTANAHTSGQTIAAVTGDTKQTADHTANIAAVLVDTGTTLPARFTGIEGATFNTSTDSLEAILNTGNADWLTGAGGSSPTVSQITADMDANSTKLASIVGDTNELQLNQGNWLTATGFNVGKTGYTLTVQDWNTVTPLDAAGIRSAVGLATANMDVQFTASVTATGFATPTNITAGTIASVTNKVSADIDSINGVTITGDGSGTPFNV